MFAFVFTFAGAFAFVLTFEFAAELVPFAFEFVLTAAFVFAVGGVVDAVAVGLELARQAEPQGNVVLDQQDAHA